MYGLRLGGALGWNARRLSFITNREIRDEYLVLSFDIVGRTSTSGKGNTLILPAHWFLDNKKVQELPVWFRNGFGIVPVTNN